MNKIQELKDTYLNQPGFDILFDNADSYLMDRWREFVPKGWYGFALGPVPKFWVLAIDDYLNYLNKVTTGLEIHQIKIKYGGLRFYVSYVCEDKILREHIESDIDELEKWLFDKKLIY